MAKKRVHELAKEFGLENKVVIKYLQQAGLSVKTHSSSVYEAEARKIIEKEIGPKTVEKAPRKGLRIKKKKKAAPVEEAPAVAVEAESTAVDEPKVVETQPEEQESPVVEEPKVDIEAAAVEPENVSEPAEVEAVEASPSAESDSASEPEVVQAEEPPPEKAPETKKSGAKVLRMIDREKLLERVPSRRLGGAEPENRSGGAGNKSFGQVTELKVVTDPFGRGREMVNVSRDKKTRGAAGKNRGGAGKRQRANVRERSVFPSRLKKKKASGKVVKASSSSQPKASKRVVKVNGTITVAEFAKQLGLKANEIIRKLMELGTMANINAELDFETTQLIAEEYEYTVENVAFNEGAVLEDERLSEAEASGNFVSRPPVVTIMGHVDHGKTSLLDAIRKTKVASGEAGGITQHIGAYSVNVKGRGAITFLDTPGHAAFTEMRARGANVTDIVVLVVAADDGVMPQTEEAIRHSQAAGVPIIVVINKMDRPDATPDKVTQELTQFQLVPEAWGGETLYVQASALKKTGIDDLLDAILLQSEMLELKASEETNARGSVVEAKLDKGRGPVATVLIQHGILKQGDAVVVGEFSGKVRAMTDHLGKKVKNAKPATAVEIIGLDGVPNAGDSINKVKDMDAAREVAAHRVEQRKAQATGKSARQSLDELMLRMSGNKVAEFNVVLKADVQGSVEAVKAALEKLSVDEVAVKVLYAGVGAIKESDIMLAAASEGVVLGFSVRPDSKSRAVAQREGVAIRTHTIIYELIDEVKKGMEGLLSPVSQEKVVGRAEVRETFRISKVGMIAGCRVVDGKASRSSRVRVLRDSVEVYDGKLSSLKHYKDDVREVDAGSECGIGVDGYNDIKQTDIIEFYEIEEIMRTLETAKRTPPKATGQAHA